MPSKSSEGFTKNAQAQKFIRNRDQKLKGKEEKKEDHISRVMCEGVCRKCREKAQWRFKYDKYKPLKAPGNCQECRQKKITKAYRTLCDSCASKKRVCSSCCVSLAEAARMDSELESALDAILTEKALNDKNEKDEDESSEEEEEDEDLKITVKPVKSLLSKSLKAVVVAGTAQTNAQNTAQPSLPTSQIPTSSSSGAVASSSTTEEENPYADFVFGDFSERKKPKRKEKKQKAVQQQPMKNLPANVVEEDGPEEEGEDVWEDAEDGDDGDEENEEAWEEEGSEEEESGDEEPEEGEEGEEEDNSENEEEGEEEEESEEEEGSDFFDESVSVADVTQRITTFGVSSSVSVCSEVSINAEIKLMDVAWDERKFTNLAASKYSKNRVVGKEGDNHYR